MPGSKYNSTSDNNMQRTVSKWISDYSDGWIKVYRLKDSALASRVARYADTHYYSTTGSATKNIHIPYGLTQHLYQFSPSYCSKLVYNAYYYGSGSAPVVYERTGYVLPYGLIDTFTGNYYPTLVHQY